MLPEEAKENTKAGATAFVVHYLAVANRALETGSTDDLVALGDDACKACGRFIANISTIYSDGGSIEGGTCVVGPVSASSLDAANWIVSVQCAYRDQVTHKGDGTETTFKGTSEVLHFVVQFQSVPKITSWTRL